LAHAKKALVHVSLVAIPVRLEVAVDKESSDHHTVCTGPEGSKHDPVRVRQHVDCATCGKTASSVWGYTERGVERDGKIVVLTAEELKAAAGEPITESMHLDFKTREDVYGKTVASDSVQNMTPGPGGEKGYIALREALKVRPDLVAVTVWSPSSKNALWVLEVVGDRIVVSKRCWPEQVRPAPAIAPVEVPEHEQTMMNMLVENSVGEFDVAAYQNMARHGIEALVAERLGDAVAAPAASGVPTVPTVDMMSALQASVDAIKSSAPKKVVAKKKAPAKKPAKKAAPKKKAATVLSKSA
jgi:DNA end-binding protein Ku